MIREAEMQEMEEKWREQNAKIMREHPADAPPEAEPTGAYPSPAVLAASAEARVAETPPEKPAETPAQPPAN
jgi:sec-independent protein translocase protein TatB